MPLAKTNALNTVKVALRALIKSNTDPQTRGSSGCGVGVLGPEARFEQWRPPAAEISSGCSVTLLSSIYPSGQRGGGWAGTEDRALTNIILSGLCLRLKDIFGSCAGGNSILTQSISASGETYGLVTEEMNLCLCFFWL